RYQKNFYSDDMVVLAISQSGETADTIAALKEVQKKGIMTLGVVNVPGSSIANMTDAGVYTHAGSEIGVASTKAFTAQMSALFMISLLIGDHKNLSVIDKRQYIEAFGKLRNQIQEVLDNEDAIKHLAAELKDYDHTFFLGRYYQVPIAYEASLKFKEITYIHSEAYPAGELKHGPLALIDPQHPSVLFAPEDGMFDKTISVYQEVSARGGKVYTVSNVEGSDIVIPKTHPILYPFLTVIVSQLLAYHTAKLLGREIDKPRNLAKSVTVE
ncbi:MAG: SIS domain-containing protein, partial [Patescibacteria group bacterium]|nr:SIS domain-containing protein [Patescibacteria group bacterium]